MPGARGIPFMPGLDGLRAVAVMAVVAHHFPVLGVTGGFLGVDLFLVLSGYLITALLLAEREDTGRIAIKDFWMRRVRRLIPAAALVIGTVAIWITLIDTRFLRASWAVVLSSIGYVTNWYVLSLPTTWELGRFTPLEHMWSLALEEQFYLVWPMIMAGVLIVAGRRSLAAGAAVGAIASSAWGIILFLQSPDNARYVYFATDTRVAGLLVGCVLAVLAHPRRIVNWRAPLWVTLIGPILLVLFVMTADVLIQAPLYFQGGIPLVAALSAGLIVFAIIPGPLRTILALRPLRWLGERSYGVYLWHVPVIILLTPNLGVPMRHTAWMITWQVALTLALAAASYRFVELPIRREGFRAYGRHILRRSA